MRGNRAASPVGQMAEEAVRRDRSPDTLLTTAKLLTDLVLGLRDRIVKEDFQIWGLSNWKDKVINKWSGEDSAETGLGFNKYRRRLRSAQETGGNVSLESERVHSWRCKIGSQSHKHYIVKATNQIRSPKKRPQTGKRRNLSKEPSGIVTWKRREEEPPHRPGRNGGENGEPVVSLRPSTEGISAEGSDQHVQCYLTRGIKWRNSFSKGENHQHPWQKQSGECYGMGGKGFLFQVLHQRKPRTETELEQSSFFCKMREIKACLHAKGFAPVVKENMIMRRGNGL